MARARNIKPGFFRNADLVELSMEARLLFIGLWTLADRAGRLEDRPKQIKMDVFPADSVDCDALLNQLAATGMVARYAVNGGHYLQVVNFSKHQNPHRDEKASTLPDQNGNVAKTHQAPAIKDTNTVQAPCEDVGGTMAIGLIPDSGFLNPDPRILMPDTGYLKPDTGTNTLFGAPHEGATPDVVEVQPAKAPRAKKPPKDPAPTAETWNAYAQAYRQRYRVDPVRNATVNGQLAQLVNRLGSDDAPGVAAWFIGHRHQFYVSTGHSVGILLRDCEKLRTEWATGRATTMTQAIQEDKTQTNFSVFDKLRQEAAIERERNNGE